MMKAYLTLAVLLAGWSAAQAADPGPSPATRVWRGVIECENLPGATTIPLKQPFQIQVTGNQAQYERNVRIADTSQDSGSAERGDGTVAPDGSIVLHGGALGPGFRYQSTYQGRLPAGATGSVLTGAQEWEYGQGRSRHFQRHCSISLNG